VRGFFSGHIIAILAAILFPVFAKAREKARQSSCLSNLKQIELAFFQYKQDYDETLPPHWCSAIAPAGTLCDDNVQRDFWASMVGPYCKNTQIFVCPSDSGPSTCCANFARSYNPSAVTSGIKDGAIQDAAGTIHLVDGYSFMQVTSGYEYPSYIVFRHNDGFNATFLDGHAKWLKSATPMGQWTLAAGD
jgi:prepilin-type processing-associated H-X9-DG protein